MNGTLGSTSMARFSGFCLSGFSLCSTLFDVGELRRRNTEEHPWLRVSAVSPPKVRNVGLTGVHAATARRALTDKAWIPIWKAAVNLVYEVVMQRTIGPAETFLGYISEVGSLISADISMNRWLLTHYSASTKWLSSTASNFSGTIPLKSTKDRIII